MSIQGSRSYGHFLHLDPKWCTLFQLKLSDGGMLNLKSLLRTYTVSSLPIVRMAGHETIHRAAWT